MNSVRLDTAVRALKVWICENIFFTKGSVGLQKSMKKKTTKLIQIYIYILLTKIIILIVKYDCHWDH